jgi:hypothetical protein
MDTRFDDPFPPSDRHLQWQLELEAIAAERERELRQILRRVMARTHTPQDVQRLVRELDIAADPPDPTTEPNEPPERFESPNPNHHTETSP